MQRMARSVLPTQKLLLAHHSHMKAPVTKAAQTPTQKLEVLLLRDLEESVGRQGNLSEEITVVVRVSLTKSKTLVNGPSYD
jgi:hypothetical protein